MIITQTPLRISLVGGGTDLPSFYSENGGAVVSMAIDKYVTILVNQKFDGMIRVSYSRTENVEIRQQVKHDIVRNALDLFQDSGLEIVSVSDIPGEGSGLGSSSSFAVGLLLALSSRITQNGYSPHLLAETAYTLEGKMCGKTLGKQDQYSAAYGGFHFYEFQKDGCVRMEPICLLDEEKCYIVDRMMLFWTGKTRKAQDILLHQDQNFCIDGGVIHYARQMRDLAFRMRNDLKKHELDSIGQYLDENWELKKKMAGGISDEHFDAIYARARQAGAQGGKLCGAGGGGFLLIYAEPEDQERIEEAVKLRRVPFRMEEKGARVIYEYNGNRETETAVFG